MRWRRWGLVLAVLAALCGLAVAGRLLDLPQDRRSFVQSTPSTTPIRLVTVATLPPPAIPEALRRPLRLPNLRHDGSCPSSPVAGPPMTTAHPSRPSPWATGRCSRCCSGRARTVGWTSPRWCTGTPQAAGRRGHRPRPPTGGTQRPDPLPERPAGVGPGPCARPGSRPSVWPGGSLVAYDPAPRRPGLLRVPDRRAQVQSGAGGRVPLSRPRLSNGDHVCVFCRGGERDELLVPFLTDGVSAGDRCLAVVDTSEPEELLDALGYRRGRRPAHRAGLPRRVPDRPWLRHGRDAGLLRGRAAGRRRGPVRLRPHSHGRGDDLGAA